MNNKSEKNSSNSLEIAKLCVAISIPLVLALFGYLTQKAIKEQEHTAKISEVVIKKRQEIYDKIGVPLNNIFCYIEEVGAYRSSTPDTIMSDRRTIHQIMHVNRAYWSANTFEIYLKYMDEVAFKTWQGGVTDAKIQADVGQKADIPSWDDAWEERFLGRNPHHTETYNELIRAIADDLVGGSRLQS